MLLLNQKIILDLEIIYLNLNNKKQDFEKSCFLLFSEKN